MKKIISLVLSVLMIVSIFPLGLIISVAVTDDVNYDSLTAASSTQNIEYSLSDFEGLADADKKVTLSFTYNQGGAKGGSQTTLSVNGTTCLSRGNGNRGFRIWGVNATNGNTNVGAVYNITVTVDYTGNAVVTFDIVSGATKASVGLTKKTTISNNKIVFALNTSTSGDTFTNVVLTKPHVHSYTSYQGNVDDAGVNKEQWKCGSDDEYELRTHTLVTDMVNSSDTVEAWYCSNDGCSYSISIPNGHNFSSDGTAEQDGTHYTCLNENCTYEKVVASACTHEFDTITYDADGEHYHCSKCLQTISVDHDMYISSNDDTNEHWSCHNDGCTYTYNVAHTWVIDNDNTTDETEAWECSNTECTHTKSGSHNYTYTSSTQANETWTCQNSDCGHAKAANHNYKLVEITNDDGAKYVCQNNYCSYTYYEKHFAYKDFDGGAYTSSGGALPGQYGSKYNESYVFVTTDIDSDGDNELFVVRSLTMTPGSVVFAANSTFTFDIYFASLDNSSSLDYAMFYDRYGDGSGSGVGSFKGGSPTADLQLTAGYLNRYCDGTNTYLYAGESKDNKYQIQAAVTYNVKVVYTTKQGVATTYVKASNEESYTMIGSHSKTGMVTSSGGSGIAYFVADESKIFYLDNLRVEWPYSCDHSYQTEHYTDDDTNECYRCAVCKGNQTTVAHTYLDTPTSVDALGEHFACQNTGCTYSKTVAHTMVIDNDNHTDTIEKWKCTNDNCTYTEDREHTYLDTPTTVDADGEHFACQNANCTYIKTVAHTMVIDNDNHTDTIEKWKCTNTNCTYTENRDHTYLTTPTSYDADGEYFACQNVGCTHIKTVAHVMVYDSANSTEELEKWICSNANCTYYVDGTHSFPDTPTRVEGNYEYYACEHDGCSYEKEVLSICEHTFVINSVDAEGEHAECSKCHLETVLDHNLTYDYTKDDKEYFECTNDGCGYSGNQNHSYIYIYNEGNTTDAKESFVCSNEDCQHEKFVDHIYVYDNVNTDDTNEYWNCSNDYCQHVKTVAHVYDPLNPDSTDAENEYYICKNENCEYQKTVAHIFVIDNTYDDAENEKHVCSGCGYIKYVAHVFPQNPTSTDDTNEYYNCSNGDCDYVKTVAHVFVYDSEHSNANTEIFVCQNCNYQKAGTHELALTNYNKNTYVATLGCTHDGCDYTETKYCYFKNDFNGSQDSVRTLSSGLSISSDGASDIDEDGDNELPISSTIVLSRYKNVYLPKNLTITFDLRFPDEITDGNYQIFVDRDGGDNQASSYIVLVVENGNMYVQSANNTASRFAISADTWYSFKIVLPDGNNKSATTYVKLTNSSDNFVSIGSHSNVRVYSMETYQRGIINIKAITGKTYYMDNYFGFWPYDCSHTWGITSSDAANEYQECSICGLTKTVAHAFNATPTTVDSDGEHFACQNANCTYVKTAAHTIVIDTDNTDDDTETWKCSNANCIYSYVGEHNYQLSSVTPSASTYTCQNAGCGHVKVVESACTHNLTLDSVDDEYEYYTCSICSGNYQIAHDIQKTDDATHEHYTCQNSGCTYVRNVAHVFDLLNTTNVDSEKLSCTNDGCSYQKTIDHDYQLVGTDPDDGLHYRCSNSYCLFDYWTACNHTWELQSENDGQFNYECTVCSKAEVRGAIVTREGNTTSDDFDGNKVDSVYDMSIYYGNTQIVDLDDLGNNVFYPNGSAGTTAIKSLINNPVPYGATMSFKIRVDNGVADGQTLSLLYDKILANKSDEASRLNGSILGINTVGGVSYLFGGSSASKKAQIEYETWYQIVVSFKVNSTDTSRVYIKGLDDKEYTLIGEFAGSANIGVSQATGDLYYFVSRDANYYIDDYKITDTVDDYVKVKGYQKTVVDDGKYNARFVLGIDGIFEGQEYIGADVICQKYNKQWLNINITTVYNSISSNYGTSNITADSIDSAYVSAITIKGIPSNLGIIELEIRPFTVINNVKVYGTTTYLNLKP